MLVFVLSFPLFFKALISLWGGHLGAFLGNAGACGLIVLGGTLMHRGLAAEKRSAVRALAFPRAPPLKTSAAAIIGVATAVAAFAAAGHGLAISLLFGMGAGAGAIFYYGIDPAPRALAISGRGIGADELRAVFKEAYAKLDGINEARHSIRSLEFQERLSSIVRQSETILKAIEEDPRDLRRARRFLNVYLDGILRVTRQYVRTHPQTQSYQLEQNYRALLVDMESVCRNQHEKLLQDDVDDLDIQIEVLSKRLKQEGVI
jgi:5-bromo-4-chloroindolyl phosphate hydrolysis protein